jgi:hypothetical protein
LEPFCGFERSGVDAHVLHLGNEIQGISTMFALRKAVKHILGEAHPELRGIAPFVDGAGATQVVSLASELVHEAVVFKHSLHREGGFDDLEVNEQ